MEIIRNNRNNFEDERISHILKFNSVSAAATTASSSRIEIFISNFFSASLSHLNSFVSGARKSTQKNNRRQVAAKFCFFLSNQKFTRSATDVENNFRAEREAKSKEKRLKTINSYKV